MSKAPEVTIEIAKVIELLSRYSESTYGYKISPADHLGTDGLDKALTFLTSQAAQAAQADKSRDNELKQKELELSTIFETMSEGLVIQGPNAEILKFNPAALIILGLSADQLLGRTSMDPNWKATKEDGSPFPGEEHPAVVALRTNAPVKNRIMGLKLPSGKESWIRINAVPFKSPSGQRLACTFSDITEILNKQKQVESLIASSPGMVYRCQLNMKTGELAVPFFTPQGYALYELSEEEVAKDSAVFFKCIHPDDQKSANDSIMVSASDLSPFSWRGRIVTGNGAIKWIQAKSIPKRLSGDVIAWEGVMLDITTEVTQLAEVQKRLETERAKAIQNSKLASLGEMSAGVAHEINNPLAIIEMSISLIPKYLNDSTKLNEKIETIKKSCERITKIVSGLKKFSRSGDRVKSSTHSLAAIAKEVVSLTEGKASRYNISVALDSQTNAKVFCNEIEIEQVLFNLINNAIDAVKDRPEKWVKASIAEDKGFVVLRVMDSGAGIEESVRGKLFDPFFTTKPVGQGTGLGLSITKGILDEHKATISVLTDCPNTCFEIRFPKAAP